MAAKSTYRITFKDAGRTGLSPEIVRVRIVLKRLLRTFGFKALKVEIEDDQEPREPDRPDDPPGAEPRD